MGTKKYKWMSAGEKLIREEFIIGIIEDEKGPFNTPEEFEYHFNRWKKEMCIQNAALAATNEWQIF